MENNIDDIKNKEEQIEIERNKMSDLSIEEQDKILEEKGLISRDIKTYEPVDLKKIGAYDPADEILNNKEKYSGLFEFLSYDPTK